MIIFAFFSNEKSKNKPPMTILVKLFPVCSHVTTTLIVSLQDNSSKNMKIIFALLNNPRTTKNVNHIGRI